MVHISTKFGLVTSAHKALYDHEPSVLFKNPVLVWALYSGYFVDSESYLTL